LLPLIIVLSPTRGNGAVTFIDRLKLCTEPDAGKVDVSGLRLIIAERGNVWIVIASQAGDRHSYYQY
jgi:myo-inositol-hexaphosphate 3-phosphohydrolase